MSLASSLPGVFDTTFHPEQGRRGRRAHTLGPEFDPLVLGDDLVCWWDTKTGVNTTSGNVDTWVDRKAAAQIQKAGTGNLAYDGSWVTIPAAGFLFGANLWTVEPPFEVWQVVDQTEAAGSANSVSLSSGTAAGGMVLAYTPPIGGQSTAIFGASSAFGGDDYHGVHVIRWVVRPDGVLGYLDRKVGIPASIAVAASIPASIYVGADSQGSHFWKGKLGDLAITRPLSSAESGAMWDFMIGRAGL